MTRLLILGCGMQLAALIAFFAAASLYKQFGVSF